MHTKDIQQIAGAIIIAGVVIAGAILLKGNLPERTAEVSKGGAAGTKVDIRPVASADHILGNKRAKLVVVEYSDTECPFCKDFHKTMHRVLDEKKGEIAWVYRHFPIPSLHPKAPHEAAAAECAYEQGGNDAFWKYIDRIFEITPSNNRLDEKELANTADYIGLNSSSFYTCLQSGKYADKVQADVDDGTRAGVGATPTSYILVNGKVVDIVPGAVPFETVMQLLEKAKNSR